MDRNREARRSSTMVAAVGLSRRRYKTISARNHIEGGHAELLATVRLRERTNKRDREKNLISRRKRRRGGASRVDFEADEDEEGEESDEESFGSEEDDEVEDGSGIPRTLSLSTTYSASNPNDRRSYLPPRVSKQTCKAADDMMIGVPIPRKTRSASTKRSHENAVSGACGGRGVFAEEKSHQNQSDSTPASFAGLVSPSSSNISDTKKIKSVGSTTQTPSPSQQNDIEFEIAEVLSGLMKQHQTFEKPGSPRNSSWKTEQEKISHIGDESERSKSLPSAPTAPPSLVLCQGDINAADPSDDDDSRKIKAYNDIAKSSPSVEDDLLAGAVHSESKHPLDSKTHSTKVEMVSKFHENQTEAFLDIFALEGPKLFPSSVFKGDDLQDLTMKKEISSVERQREEKLEFDLMISPPKSSSSAWDSSRDCFPEPRPIGLHTEMNANVLFECKKKAEQASMEETVPEGKQGKKKKINEKLNPYLEKQNQDDIFKLQLKDPKNQSRKTAIKVEKNDKSCLSPNPIGLDCGYNSLPPFGCRSSTQAGSQLSTMAQPPQCHLSQPRPRRCVTHYCIAQNIYSHQQFTKTNCSRALNGSHAIKLAPADFSGDGGNDKRIEVINFIDRVQEKQPELRELKSTHSGDLVHGHAFKTQEQTGVPARANPPGDLKSASSLSNATLSGKPVAAALAPFSAQSTNFSLNYSSSSLNQAPYLAVLPNKGIPIPISTPVGSSTAYQASSPQGMQFFNGSWYPTHMFHHSQLQHQPPVPQSIPLSRGSSSSCKQPIQQPWSVQATGNNYSLASSDVRQQQSRRQNVQQSNHACKVEETIRNIVSSTSDSKPLNPQTNIGIFTIPTQMLNFSLGPSSMLGGEEGGNHGENQHNQKLQTNGLNGKVELVPSQPTAMQLASFNGNGMASSLNFTTMGQNLTLFQNLPDQALGPAPQGIQQKNQQTSEKKSTSFSSVHDEYKKGNCGNSSTATGQTLVFNNPSRTLNFMQPPASGNWSPCSVTSNAILAKATASDRAICSQQVIRPTQLQQPQSVRTPQSKTLTHNSKPSAAHVVKCPNNVIAFQQPLIMCSSSVQSCHPKTSERSVGQLVPVQQGKAPRGQTQISFGRNHKASLVAAGTSSK